MFWLLLFTTTVIVPEKVCTQFSLRMCEPIRIEMCRGIGYNETSFPNLVGNELQSDVEINLQTFSPLIDYMCSSQLRLFLCSVYVPMCTMKVPLSIGPCRGLCQSVRSRCLPVLQGFGFPWPPALDCNRFPQENNQETMCMEGSGESRNHFQENNIIYPDPTDFKMPPSRQNYECSNLYAYQQATGLCIQKCDADVLFTSYDKNFANLWVTTLGYTSIGLTFITTISILLDSDSKNKHHWLQMLMPLFWCHVMVAIGWIVRFVFGRNATACGLDHLLLRDQNSENQNSLQVRISYLLLDGLTNSVCTATFILRYLFGMAAYSWWAVLCLGWHHDIRLKIARAIESITLGNALDRNMTRYAKMQSNSRKMSANNNISHNNLAQFVAWALPSFQTLVVIIGRYVDADELLGVCFVGNQSESGLQILVATPIFCYWIFGLINLLSGVIVHIRNRKLIENLKTSPLHYQTQTKYSGIGVFLIIYCVPFSLILIAVIYELSFIDIWLSIPINQNYSQNHSTLQWPRLTRIILELILGIISSTWMLSPNISYICKKQPICFPKTKPLKTSPHLQNLQNRPTLNIAYKSVAYKTTQPSPSNCSIVTTLKLSHKPTFYLENKKCAPHSNVKREKNKHPMYNFENTETLL